MKTTLPLLLLVAALFMSSRMQAQTQDEKYPETVLIKVYETFVGYAANMLETKILVIDADRNVTKIPLEPSMSLNDNNKELDENQLKIHQEVQKWHNKGFLVKSVSSVSPFDGLVVTQMVLQKN